jgi:hypothetical protein
MIRKNPVKFRFYDSKEKQLLYPENTPTANDIYYMVDGEQRTIGYLFSHSERFEPNQLVYEDGALAVFENDFIVYIDENGNDTDFESIVREFGEVELLEGYADFDLTSIKYINELGLDFYIGGNVYEDEKYKEFENIEVNNE